MLQTSKGEAVIASGCIAELALRLSYTGGCAGYIRRGWICNKQMPLRDVSTLEVNKSRSHVTYLGATKIISPDFQTTRASEQTL